MRHGEFDSDTAALEQRLKAHDRFGSRDLNEWIFSTLEPQQGDTVLDLGCGTGKQAIPLAQIVGSEGAVVAVDISQKAIDSLQERSRDLGLDERIDVICGSLDGIGAQLRRRQFDKIVAAFSIYYVDDPDPLFKSICDVTSPSGSFFFCGPSSLNNREIIAFHREVAGSPDASAGTADAFMEGKGQELARQYYSDVRTFDFKNPLRFESAESLCEYWVSYNLYDPMIETEFRAAAEGYFARHSFFQTTKRVIGVRARAPRI